jgi:hypothetical protein
MKFAMTYRIDKLNYGLFSVFVTINVLFPGDIFNIKKFMFLTILFLNMRALVSGMMKRENFYIVFFGFIYPIMLIVYSTLLTGNLWTSFTRSFAAFLFLAMIIIRESRLNIEKIVLNAVKLIAILTIGLVLSDMLRLIDINSPSILREMMYGLDMGLMGKSPSYPLYYKVFFKTSPLMVFLLFRSFYKENIIWVVLAIITLIVSGTRANAIFTLFFIGLFYMFYGAQRYKKIKYVMAFIGIAIGILMFPFLVNVFIGIVVKRGIVSDTVRAGHIQGLVELFNQKPWILIFGSGMGSFFYSYGAKMMVSSIEWSLLDLWRQMGAGFFGLYLVFILLPVFKKYIDPYKRFAYFTYLCIAATNPLLFSSTFYMVIYIMYQDVYDQKEVRRDDEASGNFIGDL